MTKTEQYEALTTAMWALREIEDDSVFRTADDGAHAHGRLVVAAEMAETSLAKVLNVAAYSALHDHEARDALIRWEQSLAGSAARA